LADNLVLKSLEHIWTSLESLGLPMALMGGLAVALWKHVRATHDVDLLVGLDKLTPEALLEHLQRQGFRPKRYPALVQVGDHLFLQLLYEPPQAFMDIQIDLLLAQSAYQQEALNRRLPRTIAGLNCNPYVLSCEDVILHKLIAGRVLDRSDCAYLVRANSRDLDFVYIRRWVAQLNLANEWLEAWEEACPGEASPF
jgi:hypothetical protein